MRYLAGFVVDAVGQWVGPHAHKQVGIAEPLHRLLNISHRPQGDLKNEGARERRKTVRLPTYTAKYPKVMLHLTLNPLPLKGDF